MMIPRWTVLSRIKQYLIILRDKLSRIEWTAKLLDLPCPPVLKPETGLVLIQIDGLSYRQFKRALYNNGLPFVRRLMTNQTHLLKQFYSGLPSTTPAVQAELFFGKKTAVPAFEFFNRTNGKKHVMFYPWSVDELVESLNKKDDSLLKGGTSYSNIYAAGADEARYCVQTMKLESFVRSVNPFKLLIILTLYFPKIIRILAYSLIEMGLATYDFFHGIARKQNFFKELKFIPTRIFICIILRELIRFRVKLDIKKGVRIIHANFFGYDEQAHRRGPDSAFAHWTLKGIDDVIKDIYHSALRANCRNYSLVVFSDHGQEKVMDYQKRFGKAVITSIRETLANSEITAFAEGSDANGSNNRYSLGRFTRLFNKKTDKYRLQRQSVDPRHIVITTMGPLGHVYFPSAPQADLLESLAGRLVHKANIPLVLFVRKNRVVGMNSKGVFDLHRQKHLILGEDHPFLQWVAEDLAETCRHPYAGDLVISGWIPLGTPISFSNENGAHGGPGRDETRGFILLPRQIKITGETLRPLDLRNVVRNLFNNQRNSKASMPRSLKSFSLKVMSYNIHSCINVRRKVDPDSIIKVISAYSPDIVALQEVDAHQPRSNFIDQPKLFTERLGMECHYFPLVMNGTEQFGLAILTRYPVKKIKYERLSSINSGKPREPRGAMWIQVLTPEQPVNFLNTHLGLNRNDRLIQIRTLLGKTWGLGIPKNEPLVFSGDLNAVPHSAIYREVGNHLNDVQQMLKQPGYPRATFFSRYPMLRIDHIFVSNHFTPSHVYVPNDPVARTASDHLPVFAKLEFAESDVA